MRTTFTRGHVLAGMCKRGRFSFDVDKARCEDDMLAVPLPQSGTSGREYEKYSYSAPRTGSKDSTNSTKDMPQKCRCAVWRMCAFGRGGGVHDGQVSAGTRTKGAAWPAGPSSTEAHSAIYSLFCSHSAKRCVNRRFASWHAKNRPLLRAGPSRGVLLPVWQSGRRFL